MWLIIRINNEEVSANVVKVLIHIVHELHQVKKESILDTYLQVVLPCALHKKMYYRCTISLICIFAVCFCNAFVGRFSTQSNCSRRNGSSSWLLVC